MIEMSSVNYSSLIKQDSDKILVIHGSHDKFVPIESLQCTCKNKIVIEWWDHDLERKWLIEQWVDKAVEFIIQ